MPTKRNKLMFIWILILLSCLASVVSGCLVCEEPLDSDPLIPFQIQSVFSINGYAYAGGVFKDSPESESGNQALVAVDLRRLFLQNEPLSNSRTQPEKKTAQNVFVWDLEHVRLLGSVGKYLVGAKPNVPGTTDELKLALWSNSGTAALVGEPDITIPSTNGYQAAAFEAMDDQTALITLRSELMDNNGRTLPSRIVVVRLEDGAVGRIVSDTQTESCDLVRAWAGKVYCVDSPTSGTETNVSVFVFSHESGLGNELQTLTISRTKDVRDFYVAMDGTLHLIDYGSTESFPSSIQVVEIDESGNLSVGERVFAPSVNGKQVQIWSGVPVSATQVLLSTTEGALLFELSNKQVLSTNQDVPVYSLVPAAGLTSEYYIGASADDGITLFRVSDSVLNRVGTYYRSWEEGQSEPSMIIEGKF